MPGSETTCVELLAKDEDILLVFKPGVLQWKLSVTDEHEPERTALVPLHIAMLSADKLGTFGIGKIVTATLERVFDDPFASLTVIA